MKYVKKFSELSKNDVALAGGKGASLGELFGAHLPVPDGYVVTAATFDQFLEEADVTQEIIAVLSTVDKNFVHSIALASDKLQGLILSATLSAEMADEIVSQYKELGADYVAVRSSATAEDGSSHAWAGQLDSFLNITEANLLEMVKNCWASLFTPRAIFYRFEQGLQTKHISVAVVIQKMVNAEMSGIAFSVHPVTEDYNEIIIEAGLGLGEAIVSGAVTPDSYVLTKTPLEIININVYVQSKALYRGGTVVGQGGNEWRELSEAQANAQVLSTEQILALASFIIAIENHYGFPCDIEWAYANETFYIVQSRPITTLKPRQKEAEFFDTHISLTEWFGNMGHRDSKEHRDEDNEKRERLATLNDVIGMPFDRPVKFLLTEVVNRSKEFKAYLAEHGDEKCALRLIPLESSLKKLRMRGQTVRAVTEGWLTEQALDPVKYRADYIPHAEEAVWSTIFVVNETGVRGEIIADSHEKLTQGYYNENRPISFAFDFTEWKLVPENNDAQKHLEAVLCYVKVPEDKQSELRQKLQSTFSQGYLNGYFETVDTEQGLWFIDYNRLINQTVPEMRANEDGADLSGQCASVGKYTGTVCVVNNPTDEVFEEGEVLVCDMTSPLYLPLMQKAGAIITNRGGVTCHAAIIARELGIPCIVGTGNANTILKTGERVEVNADRGVVKILAG